MLVRFLFSLLAILVLATPALCQPDSLTRTIAPWKGDLGQLIKERRPIRVLVSYNRTNFFLVKGAMRGLEHDLMLAYKQHLAKKHGKDHVHMVFIALPFDQLMPALLKGEGDIIAAGLTITDARKKQVGFSTPYRKDITEIVVGSAKAAPINDVADLAGKTVHVMAGSSYRQHLARVSKILRQRDMKPVKIKEADPNLVTEDLLEMTERGLIDYTMADQQLAVIWKKGLPRLRLFNDAPIHTGGDLGWAIRPDNQELKRSLDEFAATVRQGTLMGNMVFKRYYENDSWVSNPITDDTSRKLRSLRTVFEKYGKKYDFDWLKLVALAFQESKLNMDTKSNRGAVGIMQIKPSTAGDPNVNIKNITTLDGNVHAGTKYLRFLRDNYFEDVDHDAQVDFALAAYNAGPARVISLRKKAKSMGLDPNKWFGNVEWAAYREIGPETPTYVANVQMYYAAYKSIYEVLVDRNKAGK